MFAVRAVKKLARIAGFGRKSVSEPPMFGAAG
jgi:hypothetical protein